MVLLGKLPIYFMVQKNDGKRIKQASNKLTVGSTGTPIDMKTICTEINLEADYYPYTFSLLAATLYPDEKGTGSFEIQIISNADLEIVQLKND